MRWRSIKFAFSKRLADTESRTEAQRTRRERGAWQRRYREHLIRDDLNYQRTLTTPLSPPETRPGAVGVQLDQFELCQKQRGDIYVVIT
ncbi:hypothetical protein [Metapseudomonas otitidis]|uniref:hypothetical protein n=1 Tax=Metapseudomonas otitidis TaxID=319939 RepID=UPI003CFB062E